LELKAAKTLWKSAGLWLRHQYSSIIRGVIKHVGGVRKKLIYGGGRKKDVIWKGGREMKEANKMKRGMQHRSVGYKEKRKEGRQEISREEKGNKALKEIRMRWDINEDR
jgi:hypothetical protein